MGREGGRATGPGRGSGRAHLLLLGAVPCLLIQFLFNETTDISGFKSTVLRFVLLLSHLFFISFFPFS